MLENCVNLKRYQIKSLSNGLRIRTILEKYNPNLVILDIVLKNSSGLDILKEIKEFNPLIDVFIVTSIAKEYIKERAISLGAKFFLEKPLDLPMVKELIENELAYKC